MILYIFVSEYPKQSHNFTATRISTNILRRKFSVSNTYALDKDHKILQDLNPSSLCYIISRHNFERT
jgi:hypothetical protein